jgi:predicted ATPase
MNCTGRKISRGFFFRAESFFEFSSSLDDLATDPDNSPDEVYRPYGGRSLHTRSHGEAFLTLFTRRLDENRPSLYLFDEPEAALSAVGQMAFLRLLHQWQLSGRSQVVIASHSPILLAYPGAVIYDFDRQPVSPVPLEETVAYTVHRQFMDNPGGMLHALFTPDDPKER